MFDFIYYTVSFILWCWHKVFGFIFGPGNFIGWSLSIVFLVFTLRLILLKPAVHQVRSMRKMQKFAPEMKKIQKKYANDRQRQAAEMQKLQREHGVNPLGGCLPMILQIPVFLGLNHVLRSFNPKSPVNYFFKQADVSSYLDAKLGAAHLGDSVFGGVLGNGFHWEIAPVAIPLMIIASIATHFTARLSVQRQAAMGTAPTGQTAIMNKLTMYIFPLGVLLFGFGFPLGLLMYWLSNNVWTLAQQHFVFQKMDREEEEQKTKAVEARSALAPKPGQKPVQRRRPSQAAAATDAVVEDAVPADAKNDATPKTDAARPGPAKKPAVRSTAPRPGQKPVTKPSATQKQDGAAKPRTNGKADASPEIPGLIEDRARRKKQDRKRG